MEPDYASLDPEERTNKLLAIASIFLGGVSLCAGLIPIAGFIISILGIVAGIFGRRSEYQKIALIGIILAALGMLISFVYAIFLFIQGGAL